MREARAESGAPRAQSGALGAEDGALRAPRGVLRAAAIALLAATPVLLATAMILGSSRTLVSWNGFAHAGIAERFSAAASLPDNPFFAGAPLPVAWAHPALAWLLSRALGLDPLHALAALTLAGLAVLMASAVRLGERRYGSAGAGLLVGWLAIAGLNPFGPAIAAATAVEQGLPLFEFSRQPVESVYVSNESADLWMAHPLLTALHISADWRRGQILPWFLDNSPRGPALALLLPLAALLFTRPGAGSRAASAALGALAAALSPFVGLAATGALLAGACAVAVSHGALARRPAARAAPLGTAAVAFVGALAAAPTYLPALVATASATGLSSADELVRKSASLAASFCVLAPLACYGVWRAPGRLRPPLAALLVGGLALAAAMPVVGLAEGAEHTFANVAGVLLAIPALGFAAQRGVSRWAGVLLFMTFLPTTLCTLASFSGRPPLPISSDSGRLVRTPPDHPLAELYAWIRGETSRDAVFVVDPSRPVKMATKVSELPAFTGRALFVDQASALTTPNADFRARTQLAASISAGAALDSADAASLARLGRPVYLLSHEAGEAHLAAELQLRHGAPVFAAGFVAVYALWGVR